MDKQTVDGFPCSGDKWSATERKAKTRRLERDIYVCLCGESRGREKRRGRMERKRVKRQKVGQKYFRLGCDMLAVTSEKPGGCFFHLYVCKTKYLFHISVGKLCTTAQL